MSERRLRWRVGKLMRESSVPLSTAAVGRMLEATTEDVRYHLNRMHAAGLLNRRSAPWGYEFWSEEEQPVEAPERFPEGVREALGQACTRHPDLLQILAYPRSFDDVDESWNRWE